MMEMLKEDHKVAMKLDPKTNKHHFHRHNFCTSVFCIELGICQLF